MSPGTDWRAAAWSGVIAGLVFMMAEMMLVWLAMGMSPWGPPRMMAAIVLGKGILPPPADFSLSAIMTAMMIHLPLSAIYGLIIGWLVCRLDMLMAALSRPRSRSDKSTMNDEGLLGVIGSTFVILLRVSMRRTP